MTGPAGPSASSRPSRRLGREAEQEIQPELDDALYYLGTDCLPCAERHFEKARLFGASEEAIVAVRAKHAAGPTATAPMPGSAPSASKPH